MKRRIKIKYRNLLNMGGGYPIEIQLEVLNWMLKTGKPYYHRSGWYEWGVDKQVFGYSANNHVSRCAINLDTLRLSFLNAIISEAQPIVQQWRDDFGVKLDGHLWLSHWDERPPIRWTGWGARYAIGQVLAKRGAKLKKEHFHPEYPDRLNPYVRGIKITTCGNGLEVIYDFTFDCHPGGGWAAPTLRQREAESIPMFLFRVLNHFEEVCL